MEQLLEPDTDLAARILSKVDFDDRIIGFRMQERMGAIRASMYSFEEIVLFLEDQFPQIDFENLETWVGTIMKDPELAEKIAVAVKEESNDHDRTMRIRTLMGDRLCQCKQMNL
jgi:hypothetical protein